MSQTNLLQGAGGKSRWSNDIPELGVATSCVIGPWAVDHDGLAEVVVGLEDLTRSATLLIEQALR